MWAVLSFKKAPLVPTTPKTFNMLQANVVCRQLGFDGASKVHNNSHFGLVSDNFSYDDIRCTGDEATLDDCNHNQNAEDCAYSEGAGVECTSSDRNFFFIF